MCDHTKTFVSSVLADARDSLQQFKQCQDDFLVRPSPLAASVLSFLLFLPHTSSWHLRSCSFSQGTSLSCFFFYSLCGLLLCFPFFLFSRLKPQAVSMRVHEMLREQEQVMVRWAQSNCNSCFHFLPSCLDSPALFSFLSLYFCFAWLLLRCAGC